MLCFMCTSINMKFLQKQFGYCLFFVWISAVAEHCCSLCDVPSLSCHMKSIWSVHRRNPNNQLGGGSCSQLTWRLNRTDLYAYYWLNAVSVRIYGAFREPECHRDGLETQHIPQDNQSGLRLNSHRELMELRNEDLDLKVVLFWITTTRVRTGRDRVAVEGSYGRRSWLWWNQFVFLDIIIHGKFHDWSSCRVVDERLPPTASKVVFRGIRRTRYTKRIESYYIVIFLTMLSLYVCVICEAVVCVTLFWSVLRWYPNNSLGGESCFKRAWRLKGTESGECIDSIKDQNPDGISGTRSSIGNHTDNLQTDEQWEQLNLHSDQNRNYEVSWFKEVCRMLKLNKTCLSLYRPVYYGFIERLSHTLSLVLDAVYKVDNQKDLDVYLPMLTSVYQCCAHEKTGFSPNMLMLCRKSDILFEVKPGLHGKSKILHFDRLKPYVSSVEPEGIVKFQEKVTNVGSQKLGSERLDLLNTTKNIEQNTNSPITQTGEDTVQTIDNKSFVKSRKQFSKIIEQGFKSDNTECKKRNQKLLPTLLKDKSQMQTSNRSSKRERKQTQRYGYGEIEK